ncbi:MAG: adenylate cyclase [Lachnospiraceae bacterium]|nr:adenylate cyclase [Lachnospiraceae bacterium]
MGVEIERKFIVRSLPDDLDKYPYHVIEQGYLNVRPAIRVRREDDIYYMTYKGEIVGSKDHLGLDNERFMEGSDQKGSEVAERIGKVEYNMALDPASYDHLVRKADGNIIRKKRYLIPLNEDAFTPEYLKEYPELAGKIGSGEVKIELDVFDGPFKGTVVAEVEFPDEKAAADYRPASWFDEEVTGDPKYSNAYMSSLPADLIGSIHW